MREHDYYVYILANTFHRLYTGVTNGLWVRVQQHQSEKNPNSFAARYGIDRLVYYEHFQYVQDAIRREKQIKGWLRTKKVALIVEHNPTWRDLSEDWGKLAPRFDELKMRKPDVFSRQSPNAGILRSAQNDKHEVRMGEDGEELKPHNS